jgi:hypothetical protein
MLDEILARLGTLTPEQRASLEKEVIEATKGTLWIPNPGPQTEAYLCPADVLLYGGQGGGGKTDLLSGLALTKHQRTLMLRVQYTDLGGLIDRVIKIAGTRKGLNSSPPPCFKTQDGRVIDFGAASNLERAETWQGRPHDLIGFDEACQFQEEVVRFLMGWNRSADEDLDSPSEQRVRTVMASNPPLSAEGQWVVGMFRPWLDLTHSSPAKYGELRWYITDPDGKDLEVEGPDDCREWEGKVYRPKSRTFISAALKDNPFLINTGYQATLDAMPEPMRSAIRDGNFMAAREDDEWQVIPTRWVLAANERWAKGKPVNAAMTAMGVDPARGGRDETVLSPRYGRWLDELEAVPGRDTPDGPSVLALIVRHIRDSAPIGYDPIGIGSAVTDALAQSGLDHEPINGSARAMGMTSDGSFGFVTARSENWWRLREALDPDYGIDIALPPDPKLQADLTAPLYTVRPGNPPKIYVESKDDMKKRLGRSPDRGDAVVYSWAVGGIDGRPRKNRHDRANIASYEAAPVDDYNPLTYEG